MADDEARSDPAPATPHRGPPREPVTIEATADPAATVEASDTRWDENTPLDMSVHEPSMAAGGADLAASGGPAEAGATLAVPRPARRSIMPALLGVIGIILVLLLGANLYTMYNPPGNAPMDAVVARTEALDRRVAEVEARSGSAADLALRLKYVETDLAQLKAGAAEAQQRLALLTSQPADAAASPATAPEAAAAAQVGDQVAAVQAKLADLAKTVAGLQEAASAAPKLDLGPLDAKVAALSSSVTAVQAALAALPKMDLAPVEAAIAALDRRLDPVEAAFSAPKSTQQVTVARQEGSAAETRAAPLAVTAQAVLRAIADGKPFPAEAAALRTLGVEAGTLAALTPLADKGAPSKAELAAGFGDVRNAILAATAPKVTGGVLDRMMASATGFVKIRPAGASPGSDPDAIVSRIEADLEASSFHAALADWMQLPEAGKTPSAAWADRLKARVSAEQAAESIATGAIAAIGPSQ